MQLKIAYILTLITVTLTGTAEGKGMKGVATAYGPPWNSMQGTGVTSRGVDLRDGKQKLVVAVDPRVIPYGTKLKIWPNPFGDRNLIFTASDTGGAIKGNRIDFFVASGRKAQLGYGKKSVNISVVGRGSPTKVGTLGKSRPSLSVEKVRSQSHTPMLGGAGDRDMKKRALAKYASRRSFGKGGDLLGLKRELDTASAAAVPEVQSADAQPPAASASGLSPIKELFYDPIGGWKGQTNIGPIGGHGSHVHVAAGPKTTYLLGRRAEQMGLNVGENPKFGGVKSGGHTPTSFHYNSRAIDVTGAPPKLRAFTNFVKNMYKLR